MAKSDNSHTLVCCAKMLQQGQLAGWRSMCAHLCTSYRLFYLSEKVRNKEREWVNNVEIGPVYVWVWGRKREWRRSMWGRSARVPKHCTTYCTVQFVLYSTVCALCIWSIYSGTASTSWPDLHWMLQLCTLYSYYYLKLFSLRTEQCILCDFDYKIN